MNSDFNTVKNTIIIVLVSCVTIYYIIEQTKFTQNVL